MITPTEAIKTARSRVWMESNGKPHQYQMSIYSVEYGSAIHTVDPMNYTTVRTLLRQTRIAVALDLLGFSPTQVGTTMYNNIGSWEDVVMSYYRRHRKDQNHAHD